jgi:hypothetical protein
MDDSGLLCGDFPDRVAEKLCMVEADGSDQSGDWTDDIRRIEPPSHSNLEYGDFALRVCEGDERDERQGLEIRRRDAGLPSDGAELVDRTRQ